MSIPWLCGVVALLTLAGTIYVAGGRVDGGVMVPTAVMDAQEQNAQRIADRVRSTLTGSLQDLEQLAGGLVMTGTENWERSVANFAQRYRRYRAVYVAGADGRLITATGPDARAKGAPAEPSESGMTGPKPIDERAVVIQYVPIEVDGATVTLAAEFDLSRLRHVLDDGKPGTVWLLNGETQIIASTAGFVAFERLEREELLDAAAAKRPGVDSVGGDAKEKTEEIVSYAPVDGRHLPSGDSWRLVMSRDAKTISLPETQARDQAVLFSLTLVIITIGLFAWMYLMWLRPLRRLVHEAGRVANGGLDDPVEIRRLDEIGIVSQAIDRIRLRMIHNRTAPSREPSLPDLPPVDPLATDPFRIAENQFRTAHHPNAKAHDTFDQLWGPVR